MWCFNICNQVNCFRDWKNVLCRFKVSFEYKASSALPFPNWGNMNMSYVHLINSQFASSAGKLNPVMFASECITLWRWDYRHCIEKLLKLLTKKGYYWFYDYFVVVLQIFFNISVAIRTQLLKNQDKTWQIVAVLCRWFYFIRMYIFSIIQWVNYICIEKRAQQCWQTE